MARTQPASASKQGASEKKQSQKKAPQNAPKRAAKAGSSLVQKKLKVGKSDDPGERDADQMAEAVLRRANAAQKRNDKDAVQGEPPKVLRAKPVPVTSETEASRDVQDQIKGLEGKGQPLPKPTRDALQPHMAHDLDSVRVHTDAGAAKLTDSMNARALTVGNNVAFNRGEFQPHTPGGQQLIAHELAHVGQQQATPPSVQRAKKEKSAEDVPDRDLREKIPEADGKLEKGAWSILFTDVPIPQFKTEDHRGKLYASWAKAGKLKRQKSYSRGDPGQIEVWKQALKPDVGTKVSDKIAAAHGLKTVDAKTNWTLGYPQSPTKRLAQAQRLSAHTEDLTRPKWGGKGDKIVQHSFQVDHIVELQLAGWPGVKDANLIDNMELLYGPVNGSSGSTIKTSLEEAAKRHVEAWKQKRKDNGDSPRTPGYEALMRDYDLRFKNVRGEAIGQQPTPDMFWKREQISAGEHLADVDVQSDVVRLLGAAAASDLAWERPYGAPNKPAKPKGKNKKLAGTPFHVVSEQYATDKADVATPDLGKIEVEIPASEKQFKKVAPFTVPVKRLPGAQFAGVPDGDLVKQKSKVELELTAMSPIQFSELNWDPAKGLVGKGKVVANHEGAGGGLYKKGPPVGPDIVLEGESAKTSGSLPGDQLDLPGPIEVKSSAIVFSGDEETGLGVTGTVELEARQLGTGKFTASVGTNGFRVAGDVQIKTPWFNQTTLHAKYDRDAGLSGSVKLTVPTGKIPGLKQGSATLSLEGEQFGLAGEVEFGAFGLEQKLQVAWSEDKGITVGGSIPIPAGKVPGISGGSIDGSVTQTPEGALTFAAHGRADVGVPGLNGGIDVWWNEGIFKAEGSVGTQHENLKGNVTVGVSNEELGKDGQPTGKPGKSLHAYGKGHVEAIFGKNIRGAVDVALTPAGELILDGEIGLAEEIKLFDLPQWPRKALLGPWDIEFPILAVPAATITAFVGGGLYAEAGGGPAVLRGVKAGVHFEPSDPSKTMITGAAEFYLPMHAALILEVHAGLGARVLVAKIKGELGVDASLGLDAEAKAPVIMAWTPSAGLSVGAKLSATVQPKFAFDIFGLVGIDVWPWGEVWSHRWNLKHFEWGPGMQFGVEWPIGYKEAEGFQASIDDIKFIKPDIDITGTLKSLLGDITSTDD